MTIRTSFRTGVAMLVLATVGGRSIAAAEPAGVASAGQATTRAAEPAVKPVLGSDPKVLAILDGLRENQSALLPPVKTVGEMSEEVKRFGLHRTGPRPRDYCCKWVWAPDRKRALFCGGNAGVPHRLNDVWEYDLAANTWVLLWEPDPDLNRTRGMSKEDREKLVDSVAMVKDGVLMTKRGAPFDPVHTWWALTYDPDLKALLWVLAVHNKVHYKGDITVNPRKMMLWAYYPYEHRWAFVPQTKDAPPCQNASVLEYIPDLKGALWYTNTWRGQTTSLFRSATRTWKELLPRSKIRGNPDCPGAEVSAAYDSERKILVTHRGMKGGKGKPASFLTHQYDVRTNTWTRAIAATDGPRGGDAGAPMVYDAVAGACLIVNGQGLWSYRVGDTQWTKLTPTGPAPSGTSRMACYNPERNVLIADNGRGRVWVYRAKRRPRRDVPK